MCGDSTDSGDVALLMDGQRADICFTSPPYNMQASDISQAFKSKKVKDSYGIKDGTYREFSDDLSDEQYTNLLSNSLENSLNYCDETLFNIGILKCSKDGIIHILHKFKDKFCDILIWNKDSFMPLCLPTQKHLVGHICELIFCFNNEGDRTFKHSQWELGKMHNRIDIPSQHNNEYSKVHHATFPVALPSYIITNFTDNSVLDLFGGTGTTLIAAEQLNRKCYMMELDPHYCDVIIARWEKLTGKTATKIN
jgi:site-specific DNA-methyltransferase (adenine-specific)